MFIHAHTLHILTDIVIIHTHTYTYILTYYGMGARLLADHCRIAAQEHWHGRTVCTSIPLGNLIHFAPVDGSILALTVSCVHHLKLGVLLSGISTVACKLLDRIIQGPKEKHHALAAICFLSKIPAHYPSRNIQVDSFVPHGPHLSIADPISLKLGVGGPF